MYTIIFVDGFLIKVKKKKKKTRLCAVVTMEGLLQLSIYDPEGLNRARAVLLTRSGHPGELFWA